MKIPILKIKDYDWTTQMHKIDEEYEELMNTELHTGEEISEALDLITATFSFITSEYSKNEIKKAVRVHNKKLKGRGWGLAGFIRFKLW